MSVVLLVRHGQASFGSDDYDVLSPVGHEQSRVLGRALAARGVVPDLVLRGGMRRHLETAEGILEGLGSPVELAVDERWDEFDFLHVLGRHTATPGLSFQGVFEEATQRWGSGEFDGEYVESFPAFASRIVSALESLVGRPERLVLVVTSGGPIGLAASHVLAGDVGLWPQLNRVMVNTSVTKVLRGRSGLTLSTFNDHAHLEHDRSLVTYR